MNNIKDEQEQEGKGTQTTQIKQTKKRGVKKKTTVQDDIRMLQMAVAGVPKTDIARVFQVNEKTIYRRLQDRGKWLKDIEEVTDYEDIRSKVLSSAETKVLEIAMSNDKLSEAKFSELVNGFKEIHKANRLERNLTTDNQAIKVQMIDANDCKD